MAHTEAARELSHEDLKKITATVDIPTCPQMVLQAMKEAQKKIKSLKAYKPFEQKSRLIRFLVGRGYDYNLSKNIVDQLIKANIENEESYE